MTIDLGLAIASFQDNELPCRRQYYIGRASRFGCNQALLLLIHPKKNKMYMRWEINVYMTMNLISVIEMTGSPQAQGSLPSWLCSQSGLQ